jgi:signal peptidase
MAVHDDVGMITRTRAEPGRHTADIRAGAGTHNGPTTRTVSRAGDVLLTIASAAGALCLIGAVAAVVFHLTLILFSTGSMSPTIPAGAVALVREIPASEARIGDVVTVDRPGALPITHRVVATRPLTGGRVELVLRGDANAETDPAPYDVSHVRLVIASVPGGASVIAFLSHPLFLGSATVGATVLVAWAFWPRRAGVPPRIGDELRRTRRREGGSALLVVLAAGGASALSLAAPAPAQADESVSSSRHLTLTSVADHAAFAELRPGVPVRWEVGVAAAVPKPTVVGFGLSSTGTLTAALDIAIRTCSVRWSGEVCPGAEQDVVGPVPLTGLAGGPGAAGEQPPAPAGVVPVGAMPSSEQRWLAVDVTLRSGTSSGSADLEVWAWTSAADARVTAPTASLAATGSAPPFLAPVLAGGAVAMGTAIAGAAAVYRRRRPGREPS